MYPATVELYLFCRGGGVEISRLDRCPKCKGYVMLQRDNYGWYEECLQCGYVHDLLTVAEAEQRRVEEVMKEVISGLQSQMV
jgi:Zn ribbon nucleic-acid-binding protein